MGRVVRVVVGVNPGLGASKTVRCDEEYYVFGPE